MVNIKNQRSEKRKEREKKGKGCTKKTKIEISQDAKKLPYVHVRARHGQATDRHSLAEREKINAPMKLLRELVPGCNKGLFIVAPQKAWRWRRCRRRFAGKEVVTRWHLMFFVNYIVHDGVNLFYARMWRLRWHSNLGKWMIAKALRGAFSLLPLSTGFFKLWG